MFLKVEEDTKPQALLNINQSDCTPKVDVVPNGLASLSKTRNLTRCDQLECENATLRAENAQLKVTPYLPSELRLFAGAADAIESRLESKPSDSRKNFRKGMSGSMSAIGLEKMLEQDELDKVEQAEERERKKCEREERKKQKEQEKIERLKERERKKRSREEEKARKVAEKVAKRNKVK